MKLDTEFVRLPLRFDAERIAVEVSRIAEDQWRPHPQGAPGNTALQLVSAGGDPEDDSTGGPMRPTVHLSQMPYVRTVLASFGSVIGRTRFMRIEAEETLASHSDIAYYWRDRVRIHVPIVTDPSVRFVCDGQSVHMAAGEAWVFDTWKPHGVHNPSSSRRIHLVIDTVGSARLWELIDRGHRPFAPTSRINTELTEQFIGHDPASSDAPVLTEAVNRPVVMSPWEQEVHTSALLDDLVTANPPGATDELQEVLRRFRHEWRSVWAVHGPAPSGRPDYRRLRDRLAQDLTRFAGQLRLPNGIDGAKALRAVLVEAALDPAGSAPAAPDRARRSAENRCRAARSSRVRGQLPALGEHAAVRDVWPALRRRSPSAGRAIKCSNPCPGSTPPTEASIRTGSSPPTPVPA